MGVYIGKQRVGVTLLVDKEDDLKKELDYQEERLQALGVTVDDLPVYEPITDDLNEQKTVIEDIKSQVDSLKDISDETLNITENGEYDVVDYGKVVVSVGLIGGNEIAIPLPNEFSKASSVYCFQVDDDTILLSTGSNKGLWAYKISTNIIEQKYTSGNFSTFQMVNNKCLMPTSSYTFLVYDLTTDTVKTLALPNQNWVNLIAVGNKCLISNGYSSYPGIWLYNSLDDSISQIYDDLYSWQYSLRVAETKWLISSNFDQGLLMYNSDDDSISKVYATGAKWIHGLPVGENYLISSDNSNSHSYGILFYNAQDNTLTVKNETGYSWTWVQKVTDTRWLISCKQSGKNTGILVYDLSDQSLAQIHSTGDNFQYFHKVNDNKWLISTSNSNVKELLSYDVLQNTTTSIASYYNRKYFHNINNGCIVSGENNPGVHFYNANDDSFTQLYSTSTRWKYFQTVGNNCLIGSEETSSGLVLYQGATNTGKRVFSTGYQYDTFTVDNEGCLAESSDKTKSTYGLYYNLADETVSVAKYYLEVQ